MSRVAAASIALLLLASCAANEDLAGQGERQRAGKDRNKTAEKSGSGKKDKPGAVPGGDNGSKEAEVAEEIEAADPGSGGTTAQAPQDFGGDAPTSGIDPSLARASSSEQDSPSDARKQGLTPDYTETTAASIQGLGENVRFTMTFGGNVPDQVQKDQYMVLAFGVTGRREGEGYAVGATCNDKGWHPYARGKSENEKFPGRFEVTGNQVIMEVPWSYVRGPRAFEWYASTGWYGKVANQTHWSFDAVPNERAGRFPG